MNNESKDSLLGMQLDEYRLEALLGHGGMARVYRALDVRLRRYAAIKVIDTPFRQDAEYVRRFDREAQAIARLEHPNVVRLYRYGQVELADGSPILYMAMQFIQGKDLGYVLDSIRLDGEYVNPEEGLQVIWQACRALDYVHSQGIIHRDVKPSNIMLSNDDGHAILTDFGLALLTQAGTRGEIFGSPHYIAPEQAVSSARAVPQSDLYALGVILFEMFTGVLPFNAPDPLDIALLHMSEPPPSPRAIRPEISPAVEEVILKALAKQPHERFQTGQALASALEQALHGQPVVSAPIRRTVLERVTFGMAANPLPPLPASVTPPPTNPPVIPFDDNPERDPSNAENALDSEDEVIPSGVPSFDDPSGRDADPIQQPAGESVQSEAVPQNELGQAPGGQDAGAMEQAIPSERQEPVPQRRPAPPTVRLLDELDIAAATAQTAGQTESRPPESRSPVETSPEGYRFAPQAPAQEKPKGSGVSRWIWIGAGALLFGLLGLVCLFSIGWAVLSRSLPPIMAARATEQSPKNQAAATLTAQARVNPPAAATQPAKKSTPTPTRQAPTPTQTEAQRYTLTIARCRDEGCVVLRNDSKFGFPLAGLRLLGKNGQVQGSEWGIDLLLPGECVEIIKDEDWYQRLPTGMSCALTGNNLSREEGKERFWKDAITVEYNGEKAGVCPKNRNTCEIVITK